MDIAAKAALERVKTTLLLMKTWRYLRYCHAREALKLAPDASSVLVVGAGHGIAEIALALEFSGIHFFLTDYAAAAHDSSRARDLVDSLNLSNVSFGQLDILAPDVSTKFDLVYSIEVLEHIEDATAAARNLRALSSKYVFTLVPFGDERANGDVAKRERVLRDFGHYVVGYDAKRLEQLFPNPVTIRGCYWKTAGQAFRARLQAMSSEVIRSSLVQLEQEAAADYADTRIPQRLQEALGIWSLSRVDASMPNA